MGRDALAPKLAKGIPQRPLDDPTEAPAAITGYGDLHVVARVVVEHGHRYQPAVSLKADALKPRSPHLVGVQDAGCKFCTSVFVIYEPHASTPPNSYTAFVADHDTDTDSACAFSRRAMA